MDWEIIFQQRDCAVLWQETKYEGEKNVLPPWFWNWLQSCWDTWPFLVNFHISNRYIQLNPMDCLCTTLGVIKWVGAGRPPPLQVVPAASSMERTESGNILVELCHEMLFFLWFPPLPFGCICWSDLRPNRSQCQALCYRGTRAT